VFAEDEADVLVSAARTPSELAAMVERRVDGLPLEHVVGWAQFCGLRIAVADGVFVPRHRSELLARTAAGLVDRPGAVVVDLCCGSGALGAVVAATARHPVRLYAADLDHAAVACARENLEPYGGLVLQGDLFDALPSGLRGRVAVLAANVPYVPTGAIELLPREARLHEPRLALDGGGDGLDVLRRVAAGAASWLAPGGHLLVETSERQLAVAEGVVRDAGLSAAVVRDEELEATVLVGRSPVS
jgi:release factor glutamine methyltransferase